MLSTIIIFKRCKFNINQWTLCFVLQKVPESFNLIDSGGEVKDPMRRRQGRKVLVLNVGGEEPK